MGMFFCIILKLTLALNAAPPARPQTEAANKSEVFSSLLKSFQEKKIKISTPLFPRW